MAGKRINVVTLEKDGQIVKVNEGSPTEAAYKENGYTVKADAKAPNHTTEAPQDAPVVPETPSEPTTPEATEAKPDENPPAEPEAPKPETAPTEPAENGVERTEAPDAPPTREEMVKYIESKGGKVQWNLGLKKVQKLYEEAKGK